MNDELLDRLRRLGGDLAPTVREAVARVLESLEDANDPRALSAIQGLPDAYVRDRCNRLLTSWRAHAPNVTGAGLALALETAARAHDATAHEQRVSAVWTGPPTDGFQPRRTAQVLEELLVEARESIWVVTFAVHGAEGVFKALRDASDSGVAVNVVLESKKESGKKLDYDRIPWIRKQLGPTPKIYVWPAEQRPEHGVLHAKCAVADGKVAFITSANLTDRALEENMELGVLVRGPVAGKLARHFGALVAGEVLLPVE